MGLETEPSGTGGLGLGGSPGVGAQRAERTWLSSFPSSPFRGAGPLSTKRRLEEEQEPLRKQFLSEENMATHFSRLSLHNDHPYCSPPRPFPPPVSPPRNPRSELLLWRYPGNLIPETLRLLRLGDIPGAHYPATPAGDVRKL
ncbi:host cell factor C1 regulator 1 isoform X1 [Erinaceus europaeus]|uniref:Host cell factor C1 regulator 1 isoform X1 n=1 Tax=Erinaceus europaeus TaxID=9365 RepID=A0ABM3VW05_ERIEU|nr:host cell factor C1 regulator 1 isoform X1 [Erinaceus europaeus]